MSYNIKINKRNRRRRRRFGEGEEEILWKNFNELNCFSYIKKIAQVFNEIIRRRLRLPVWHWLGIFFIRVYYGKPAWVMQYCFFFQIINNNSNYWTFASSMNERTKRTNERVSVVKIEAKVLRKMLEEVIKRCQVDNFHLFCQLFTTIFHSIYINANVSVENSAGRWNRIGMENPLICVRTDKRSHYIFASFSFRIQAFLLCIFHLKVWSRGNKFQVERKDWLLYDASAAAAWIQGCQTV